MRYPVVVQRSRSPWYSPKRFGKMALTVCLIGGGWTGGGWLGLPPVVAQEPATTLPKLAVTATDAASIPQALLGRWQTQNPNMTLIFAPEGKLFLLLDSGAAVKLAEEIRYHLNLEAQPMQIDLTLNQDETIATIFELTADRQLRLELTHVAPGDERPTAFTEQALVFEQTSRSTTPPHAAAIQSFDQRQNQAREREAQLYMGALAQAQAAFYQRYEKFAATFEEFVAGIEPETDFYRYRVVPNANPTLGVILMAQAKTSGLRSFTSLVFASPREGTSAIGTTLCQSARPSTIPPTLLVQMPVQDPQKVNCPIGSQRLN